MRIAYFKNFFHNQLKSEAYFSIIFKLLKIFPKFGTFPPFTTIRQVASSRPLTKLLFFQEISKV